MICDNNYLADIFRVCEIKDLIWVMRFQSPLVYYNVYWTAHEKMVLITYSNCLTLFLSQLLLSAFLSAYVSSQGPMQDYWKWGSDI